MILLELTVDIISNQVAASLDTETLLVNASQEDITTSIETQEVALDYGFS